MRKFIFLILAGMIVSPETVLAYKLGDVGLKPFGSLSEGYDDNITAARSARSRSVFTDLTGGLDLSAEGKNQHFLLSGSLSRKLFSSQHRYDFTSENLDADYKLELSPVDRVHMLDSFIHSEDPGSLADAFGRTTGRFRYSLNRFNADMVHEFSKESVLTTGYGNEYYRPSRSDAASSVQNAFSVKEEYSLSSAAVLVGIYSLDLRTFDPGGRIDTNNVDLGIRRYLTNQLYLDIFPGIGYVQSTTGKNFMAPRYEVSLANDVTQTTRLKASFIDRTDSNYSTDDVFSSWRISLDLHHQVRERLALMAGVFYGDGRYHAASTRDRFNGANVRLNYDLTKTAVAFVSLTRMQTSSSESERDYTRDVSTVGIQLRF